MWSWRKRGQTGQFHQEGHAHPAGQVRRQQKPAGVSGVTNVSKLQRLFRFFSLPEVPALVDVPSVSAQLDDSLLGLLRDWVSRHGFVSSHPPVQIEELQERPGSILVRWCKVGRAKGENSSCRGKQMQIWNLPPSGGRGLHGGGISAAIPAVWQQGEPIRGRPHWQGL